MNRVVNTLALGVGILVVLCIAASFLVGLLLWIDDAWHRRCVARDARLEEERITAIAEAGMRDFDALLADHGHDPN